MRFCPKIVKPVTGEKLFLGEDHLFCGFSHLILVGTGDNFSFAGDQPADFRFVDGD